MFTQREDYRSKFGDLSRRNVDEVRMYSIDETTAYPSITSIISFINRDKFADWRAKVGNEAANKKTKHATRRGTDLHLVFEKYLQNEDLSLIHI